MNRYLSDSRLNFYGAKLATFTRVALVCIVAVLAMAYAAPSAAQTTSFTLTQTVSSGRPTPTLTWSNPTATSCTASGDAAWTAAYTAANRPVTGTVTLAALAPPNARSYTLNCSWPGDTTATVSWAAPTTNSDGSPLTDLASYKVFWNTGDASVVDAPTAQMRVVTAPATSTVITGLTPGVWNFGVKSTKTTGVDSSLSNIDSKTITAAVTNSQTRVLVFPGTVINVTAR